VIQHTAVLFFLYFIILVILNFSYLLQRKTRSANIAQNIKRVSQHGVATKFIFSNSELNFNIPR